MSVNLNIQFMVLGLASGSEAEAVHDALDELMERERLDGDMSLFRCESEEGEWRVCGLSDGSVIISQSWRWWPEFERDFHTCVTSIAPHARIDMDNYDVDEEAADPWGADELRVDVINMLPENEQASFLADLD
ncbi:hypothetical protein [Nocardia concava]|uniref:hypothetical protein n=1 Tax=Nocardia concava TaxID=257281 RepID=UPI0005945709|nr:hypothetical protein [Nocardia concava]